jgi:hypothetical protein
MGQLRRHVLRQWRATQSNIRHLLRCHESIDFGLAAPSHYTCQPIVFIIYRVQVPTYLQGLLMPRKRYGPAHKLITPQHAFTGTKPSYKRIEGMVIGMRCWYYNTKALRYAMQQHDGEGWWCGFDEEMPGGHIRWGSRQLEERLMKCTS